ncbi:MAG: Kynureninase [Flavobacteriaceae bacterium]|nr:MAG: Kynureninase [Flavobacteriaceae bacterium]
MKPLMIDWKSKALEWDLEDPLASFRERFIHPPETIYLDGNSLGKLPHGVARDLEETIQKQWGQKLIRSWNDHWFGLSNRVSKKLAELLRVTPTELIVGESTSVRLFQIAQALAHTKCFPSRLVTDSLNFPTDSYILDAISKQTYDAPTVRVNYKDTLRADLNALKSKIDSHPGIYCLSLVSYQSGYAYPIKQLNRYAAANNSLIIWDLSHAVGVLDIDLKETETKAAIGCTYKYLNGGPGAPAFLYVDAHILKQIENPIAGWFGHARPFNFESEYQPASTIQKMAVGTPSILSLVALEKGLELTLEAGISKIRHKSVLQSTFLYELVTARLEPLGIAIESPPESDQRGSHISISHPEAWRITKALQKGTPSIIPDFRPDRFIRLGIAPLYTRFSDLLIVIDRLEYILSTKEYLQFTLEKPHVT